MKDLNIPTDLKRHYTNERMFVLQMATHLGRLDDLDTKAELRRLEKLANEVT